VAPQEASFDYDRGGPSVLAELNAARPRIRRCGTTRSRPRSVMEGAYPGSEGRWRLGNHQAAARRGRTTIQA